MTDRTRKKRINCLLLLFSRVILSGIKKFYIMTDVIEKSPGRQAIAVMKDIDKDLVLFKKPMGVPKRRKSQIVLDEDSYVEVSVFVIFEETF